MIAQRNEKAKLQKKVIVQPKFKILQNMLKRPMFYYTFYVLNF